MKISTFAAFALDMRRTTVLAAIVTMAPLLGACVSAVDESSAFGFNGAPTTVGDTDQPAGGGDAGAETTASAETAGIEGDALAEASDAPEPAAAGTDTAGIDPSTPAEQTTTSDETGQPSATLSADAKSPATDAIASGKATIAAYAGATVSPASETTPSMTPSAPKADQTLFASLFAQSEAKTPVRNADTGKSRRVILKPEGAPVPVSFPSGETTALASLPGVKSRESLFEIGQKASADYDAEILEEASGDGEESSYQVASLSGFARLSPNGLMVQRPDVQTSCFEPKLVSMLRAVEARFRTKVVVTSGYRSPTHNKRVNGARKSMHMACKAADIQVPGANKLDVANFVRSLPGRGGVGTYCHTTAVHIDIGRERDWNWACRRRRS